MEARADVGAVLLVGGRSRRMGGGSKPLIEIGGHSLLARTAAALTDAACAPIIVAGPVLDETLPVRWVREDPPFGGPVAAIAAALTALAEPGPQWMLLLAGDLPYAASVVRRLISEAAQADAHDALVFAVEGHPQWLAGVYRTDALRAALAGFREPVEGASCRALLGGLEIAWLSDEDGITADIDTPADLARVRAELEEQP